MKGKILFTGLIALLAVFTLISQAQALELVTNGGFETGNFSGWTAGGPSTHAVVAAPYSGSYSAQLGYWDDGYGGEPSGSDYMYQTISLPSTATSTNLSFWYRMLSTDSIYFDGAVMVVQDSTGSNNLATVLQTGSIYDTGWTNKTYDLTAYQGQNVRLLFYTYQDAWGDQTTTYFDNISVNANLDNTIPEPASLSLLGLGLSGLLFRKKRIA